MSTKCNRKSTKWVTAGKILFIVNNYYSKENWKEELKLRAFDFRHDCAATRILWGKLVFPIFFLWVSYVSRIFITKIIRAPSLSSSCSITTLSSPSKPFGPTINHKAFFLEFIRLSKNEFYSIIQTAYRTRKTNVILLHYMKQLKKTYELQMVCVFCPITYIFRSSSNVIWWRARAASCLSIFPFSLHFSD